MLQLQDNMMVPIQKSQHPPVGNYQESKSQISGNALELKLTKLSMSMKNDCGIHFKYLTNMNGKSLQTLVMLSPECQIQVLEKNINFLFKKSANIDYLKAKNNSCTSNSSASVSLFERPHSKLSLGLTTRNEDDDQPDLNLKLNPSNLSKKSTETNSNSKIASNFKGFCDSILPNHREHEKFDEIISQKKTKAPENKTLIDSSLQDKNSHPQVIDHVGSGFTNVTNNVVDKTSDVDNQFEFTVEQEKIVSFVCSPSPSRRSMSKSSTTSISDIFAEDSDTDQQSNISLSNEDFPPKTVSNLSAKSNNFRYFVPTINEPPSLKKLAEPSKLLWHPLLQQSHKEVSPFLERSVFPDFKSTTIASETDTNNPELGSFSCSQNGMESSFNQETTWFREVSLRNLYNMENIVKSLSPPLVDVHKEIKEVRESIFSAVGVQPRVDDIVPDAILSAIDICKSWLKLSSHFKGNHFKEIEQWQGSDFSIFNDFLQWQCVSRVFIDKLVNTLTNITLKKESGLWNGSSDEKWSSQSVLDHKDQGSGNSSSFLPVNCKSNFVRSQGEMNPNKNWKQRRFLHEQTKHALMSTNKLCHSSSSVVTMPGCDQTTPSSYSFGVICGQGDTPLPKSYEAQPMFNQSLTNKPNVMAQGDSNFNLNCYSVNGQSTKLGVKNDSGSNIHESLKGLKEAAIFPGDPSICRPGSTSISTGSSGSVSYTSNHHNAVNISSMTHSSKFFEPQYDVITNQTQYLVNNNQKFANKNPIKCVDNELNDTISKISYMKPGSYNPPQKHLSVQKSTNNNIPIEDAPVIGIPFLYSTTQGSTMSFKALNSTTPAAQNTCDNKSVKQSDEKWKAALTSAESFRDNLMCFKTENVPNFKFPDPIPSKTHFLLSDQVSHAGSSKLSNETEELSPTAQTGSSSEIPLTGAQDKTSDWLMKSFNKAVLENETKNNTNLNCSSNIREKSGLVSNSNIKTNSNFEDFRCQLEESKPSNDETLPGSSNFGSYDPSEHGEKDKYVKNIDLQSKISSKNNSLETYGSHIQQRKPKKNNRKIREDFNMSVGVDQSCLPFYRKQPPSFRRTINKQIALQLEDILNCICKTDVSSLVEMKVTSIKETSRLELKIRCPLYLQAMRCKLANQSYDTLDQALADFQQYFCDIKCRNKGDKQCIEVAGALEQVFLDLVEKHFGLTYQPSPDCFNPKGGFPTTKPRKQKKASRRF